MLKIVIAASVALANEFCLIKVGSQIKS